MSLQQLLECRFEHGTRQLLNRGSQHDTQLAIAMLKSNLVDLLPIDESLKVDNLWIPAIGLLRGGATQEDLPNVARPGNRQHESFALG
jgi:hypothetical protein